MEKISSTKVAAVLAAVPGMLRSLKNERDQLREKTASLENELNQYKQQMRIDNLAKEAEQKGIDVWGATHADKVAAIQERVSSGNDIAVLEEAIKLSSPQYKMGSLSEDKLENTGSQLEAYLSGAIE